MNEDFKLSDITTVCNSGRSWLSGGVRQNKMLFSGKKISVQEVHVQIFILSKNQIKIKKSQQIQ